MSNFKGAKLLKNQENIKPTKHLHFSKTSKQRLNALYTS